MIAITASPSGRRSIYPEPELDRALSRRAAAERTTKAELIRSPLRQAAGGSPRVKPAAKGVVDTSVILAYMNAADIHHASVSAWLDAESDEPAVERRRAEL